jgi:hypothetical protein
MDKDLSIKLGVVAYMILERINNGATEKIFMKSLCLRALCN